MLRHAVAAAFVGVIAAPAHAADENDQFAVRGAGIASCAQYLEARDTRSQQYFQFGGWMNGYLSAMNRFEDNTFDLVPWQSPDFLATALANYCAQNPEQSFHNAVLLMAESLKPQRLESRSVMLNIEVGGGGQPLRLYQETFTQAMAVLGAAGYPVAMAPTDAFSEDARQALTAFQEAEGLPVTGLPDQPTLLRLFYPQARPGGEYDNP